MKSTICALNAELAEANKILADNQPLVSLCAQLSKLKSINKQPSSLAADRFYAVAQAVMLKALTEVISLGDVSIVAGLLSIPGINYNKIISGISNYISSPSNLRYVVKKSLGATFMRIVGFVYKYPCSVSCNKVELAGLGCLVKEISFWDGERVQPI